MFCDPRAELALAIHAKTDNGNDIVDFLKDVLDQNIPDVRLTHRLQSARMLTKHGHFPDAEQFIRRHANKPGPRKTRRDVKETSEFDAALAEVIRVEISPASTAQWLIDVMQGRTPAIETGIDTFKPHHRMRAVREILARAYDRDYSYATETRQPQTHVTQPVTSEDADSVAESTEQATEDALQRRLHPEEQAQIQEVLDRIKKIAEEADPSGVRGGGILRPEDRLLHVGHHRQPSRTRNHRRTGQNRSRPLLRSSRKTATLERVQRQGSHEERQQQL